MDERTYDCPHCGGNGKLPARPFVPGDKLWWKGGGYGYKDRIPVTAVAPISNKSFRISFIHGLTGGTMTMAARLTCLTFRAESSHSAGAPHSAND